MGTVDNAPSYAERSGTRPWLLFGLAALAFSIRLIPVLSGGGLRFYGRYDDGVYYTAADALTFGRLPYRNFVLLHPPGLMVLLTPFAFLGRLTTDGTGMEVARLTFMAIGALNTVLIFLVADRWGRKSALAAALLYAGWLPAVYGEQSTMLEPLGGTATLVALLLVLNTKRRPTVRADLLAGIALGLGVTMKIWYVAPFATIVVWQLMTRRSSAAVRILLGGIGAMLVVVLPFAILAPTRMFDMVVRDQLLRPPTPVSRAQRLSSILGVRIFSNGRPEVFAFTLLALGVLIVVAVVCWRVASARLLVGLLGVNLLILMVSAPYYQHYAAFTAGPAALVFGVGVGRLATLSLPRPAGRGFAVALMFLAAGGIAVAATPQGKQFPSQFGHAAPPGCVSADDPLALIDMNRLSSDLKSGCELPVDVTGITYDTLHATRRRRDNYPWQFYLENYLFAGRSFVVARRHNDAIAPFLREAIARRPALAKGDGLVLRAADGSGPVTSTAGHASQVSRGRSLSR